MPICCRQDGNGSVVVIGSFSAVGAGDSGGGAIDDTQPGREYEERLGNIGGDITAWPTIAYPMEPCIVKVKTCRTPDYCRPGHLSEGG